MNSNDNNLQSVGWGLIALGIIGWIIISVLNEFRQAPWQFISVFIAFVGALVTYTSNLQMQIRNEQIDKKTQIYEELVHFFFEIIFAKKINQQPKSENETIEFLVKITPKIIMYASDNVLNSFIKFRTDAIQNTDNSIINFGEMLLSIRKDLGHNNSDLQNLSILSVFINDVDTLEKVLSEIKNKNLA